MISKAQSRSLVSEIVFPQKTKLSALEKAMLRWVVVDPEDKLLDASIGAGKMAEYLRRNMQCEVCGVSDDMEDVRYARSLLQSCDIIYAPAGDIPWREDSFDTVLYKLRGEEPEVLGRILAEAWRVLKPGGQLIIGMMCYPAPVMRLCGMLDDEIAEDKRLFRRQELAVRLEELAFEQISWERTGFGTGVMIAWKHKPGVPME